MSFQPEVVSMLNNLYRQVFHTQQEPASLIVPVMEFSLPNSNNDGNIVYMNHELLPAPQMYSNQDTEFMAHPLNNAFLYECIGQQNSGSFHMIGEPGLFSLGAVEWLASIDDSMPFGSEVNSALIVERNYFGQVVPSFYEMKGSNKVQVFLNTGDMFRFVIGEFTDTFMNTPMTQMVITRLSRNPDYRIPVPP